MIRLYFNKHGKKPWSTDSGPGTPELQWSAVTFCGGKCRCVYAPEAGDDENSPTAWIEIDDDAGFGLQS